MGKPETIYNELAYPIRSQILEELLDSPLKLNEIASKFSISKSEISRHLSRLLEINIVTKDNSNHNYLLTPLGEAYTSLSLPVKFVLENNSFFENHFIDLPHNLYRMIDNLDQAKQIHGPGEVLTTIQNLLENTNEQVQILLDQKYPLSLNKKIKFGKYVIVPEMVEKGIEYAKKTYDRVEAKMFNAINHNMIITDGTVGIINFPGLNHKADITTCFLVTDSLGLEYLQHIWTYYWNQAELIPI